MRPGGVVSLHGVARTAQPYLCGLLHLLRPDRPLVVVTEGLKSQELFLQDLQTWSRLASGGDGSNPAWRTWFFPDWEILPEQDKLPHLDVISDRLETLAALHSRNANAGIAPLVVTNGIALTQRTLPRSMLSERTRALKRGDRADPLDLVEWLEEQGYEPEVQVDQKGQIAMRGGIVDVFPLTAPWPVRLEFFGDELESIRYFDPASQISREEIGDVILPPGGELGLLKQRLRSPDAAAATDFATLLDHVGDDALLVVCEPEQVTEAVEQYLAQVEEGNPLFTDWTAAPAGSLNRVEVRELGSEFDLVTDDELAAADSTGLDLRGLESFRPIGDRPPEPQIAEAQRRAFFQQLHRWSRQGHAVHVFCNNDGERQRFNEVWREMGFDETGSGGAGRLLVEIGALARGFVSDADRLVVVTDAEVFGRYKIQRPRRLKAAHAPTSRSLLDIDFTDLEEGDLVVHLQHGIGRYLGLSVVPSMKRRNDTGLGNDGQECLVIEYAAKDSDQPAPKLYVPITEAHLVGKYVGAGRARPPLNQLGGTRWTKAKEQAEDAVRDLASELLSIQAARETQAGHSFGPDTVWQREFEDSFLYEETPDQMKAITDARHDMERPKPMDRLVCGDVGYGKTEVAIRAAFKAVMDGKQVAVLVPTTVLAQQHYNTFRERMSDYPVSVEVLSRYRTRKQQEQILVRLAAGSVDIVIGTHRLVQKDVAFKDLGLVVIDEEQRFGVKHKEQFKLLRRMVDVLTLSATPIPRTLYQALTGARDMSTIETPPQDRLPVETIVTQFDERVVRDAIRRELQRQGQVFFLHNRVGTIEAMALRVKKLVPEARVLIGHGQMDANELEEVMTTFVNGEADVLISTTIIESGLDIPNANTIIIDRADRFGLAELYQLRGRVGRYKHQAYAYLLIPRHARLLTDARKRISAIKQYSSLGSGFKIAMRDLEIRGAGNLLGPQQSGHITAVGFDLYCQLLAQSVAALKGEKPKARIEVALRIDFLTLGPEALKVEQTLKRSGRKQTSSAEHKISVPRETAVMVDSDGLSEDPVEEVGETANASIPLSYVPEPQQRVEIYRKLAQLNGAEELERLRVELRDRFGVIPEPCELLLQIAELKLLASAKSVDSIEVRTGKLILERNGDYLMMSGKFPRLAKKKPAARLQEIRRLLQAM